MQFTIPSATCEDRVEEIYEDLCYVKLNSTAPEVADFVSRFFFSGVCFLDTVGYDYGFWLRKFRTIPLLAMYSQ